VRPVEVSVFLREGCPGNIKENIRNRGEEARARGNGRGRIPRINAYALSYLAGVPENSQSGFGPEVKNRRL